MKTTEIEQQIASLEWRNDKGIHSTDGFVIAILVALNEINKNLEKIANQGINVRCEK